MVGNTNNIIKKHTNINPHGNEHILNSNIENNSFDDSYFVDDATQIPKMEDRIEETQRINDEFLKIIGPILPIRKQGMSTLKRRIVIRLTASNSKWLRPNPKRRNLDKNPKPEKHTRLDPKLV